MSSKDKKVSKKTKSANNSIKHKTSKPLNKSGKNFGNKKNIVKKTKPKSKNILTKDAVISDISANVSENKKKFSSRKVLVNDNKKVAKNTKFAKNNKHQNNKKPNVEFIKSNSKKPFVKNNKSNKKNNHFKSVFSKVLKFLKK